MKDTGMEYQSIDACPNDHIIYYGKYSSKTKCLQCHIIRYQIDLVTRNVRIFRHLGVS